MTQSLWQSVRWKSATTQETPPATTLWRARGQRSIRALRRRHSRAKKNVIRVRNLGEPRKVPTAEKPLEGDATGVITGAIIDMDLGAPEIVFQATRINTTDNWHCRVGHINNKSLVILNKTDSDGMHLVGGVSDCDFCAIGKSTPNGHKYSSSRLNDKPRPSIALQNSPACSGHRPCKREKDLNGPSFGTLGLFGQTSDD